MCPAEQRGAAASRSPHLAYPDHLPQRLQPLHAFVLHGHGEEDCSVSSFLRHKCYQVLCKDMDERLVKGRRRNHFNCKKPGFFLNVFMTYPLGTQAGFPHHHSPHVSPCKRDSAFRQHSEHSSHEHTAKDASLHSFSQRLSQPRLFWLSLIQKNPGKTSPQR